MRIPLFGFAVANQADLPEFLSVARQALTKTGYDPETLIAGTSCAAVGDDVQTEGGVFAVTGIVPEETDPTSALRRFAQEQFDQTVDTRQVPDGSFVLAFQRPKDPSKLILATDKYGTMPLFYLMTDKGCWFSNDQKLLFGLNIPFRLRPLSLPEGLHRLVPPPPLTHFDEIKSLPLSTCVEIDLNTAKSTEFRYHAIEKSVDTKAFAHLRTRSDAELSDTLEHVLRQAVQNSVAPYKTTGVLLSGGVDSSLLAAFAKPHTDLIAVHIDQPDGESELDYAQTVARKIGVDLHVIDFTGTAFRQNFVKAVWEQGQPFFIANGMGLQYAAQSGVFETADVLIDGEGADFPMYSSGIQQTSLWRFFLARQMRLPVAIVDRSLNKLAGLCRKFGYSVSVPRQGGGLHETLCARTIEDIKLYDQFYAQLTHIDDPLERDLATQVVQGYESSLQNVLTRLDSASRLSGKHTIFPYLHPDYVDLIMNLPASVKLRKRKGLKPKLELKWLVKKVAAKHLPDEAIYRPKVGFGMPTGVWLGHFPDGYKKDSWIKSFFELFDSGFDHLLRNVGQSLNLYFLVALETWGRLFDRRIPLEEVESQFGVIPRPAS